jgi:putative ATPase
MVGNSSFSLILAHLSISPVCTRQVPEQTINQHLDNACRDLQLSSKAEADQRGSSSQRQRKQDPQSSLAPIFSLTPTDSSTRTLFVDPDVSGTDPSSSSKKRKSRDTSLTQSVPAKRTKTNLSNLQSAAPLAERLRPSSLEEFVGQSHLLEPGSVMSNMLDTGSIGSMIFWGPPGWVFCGIFSQPLIEFSPSRLIRCGKTTLARILANRTDATYKELSATSAGISDVRAVFEEAKGALSLTRRCCSVKLSSSESLTFCV